MQESVEAMGQFIVPRGEAAKLLQSIEESLDEVSRLVTMPVGVSEFLCVRRFETDRLIFSHRYRIRYRVLLEFLFVKTTSYLQIK